MWEKGNRILELQEDEKEFIVREEDVWEIMQLVEICLFQIEVNHSLLSKIS